VRWNCFFLIFFFCYGREGRGDLVKTESGWRRGSNKWGESCPEWMPGGKWRGRAAA